MAEAKFKVGDRVYFPYHGFGIVTKIDDVTSCLYPIEVKWDNSHHGQVVSTFTRNGFLTNSYTEVQDQLTVVENAPSNGEKAMKDCSKFEVGDRVWSLYFGVGIVTEVAEDATNTSYPIKVEWTDEARFPNTYDYFTKEGSFDYSDDKTYFLYPLDISASSEGYKGKEEDAAINPAHYQVKGIPEAIEIMEHLMTKEQLEGFLWGNIIKYAYRYGRKGDKAETAGKIAWYAQKLKELGECGSK